ncbi:MAG: H-NS family nucleoid-associated regulatory protein [Endozoicomonas sp. (ex Botrylloides leachii)]|nr:H-NS family nucleoid-associated regulatory protein [Endozoicomonas sp. (ex Botrylloides leachii)]
MNIFEEVISRLNSKANIRSLFNDVHTDDMKKMINRLNSVLDEKIKTKDLEIEKRKKKKEMINKIQKTMKENGLSLDDFYDEDSDLQSISRKHSKKKYSFEYVTPVGDTVYWYGAAVGRVPKPFQHYLDKTGKKRMDCIVVSNTSDGEEKKNEN